MTTESGRRQKCGRRSAPNARDLVRRGNDPFTAPGLRILPRRLASRRRCRQKRAFSRLLAKHDESFVHLVNVVRRFNRFMACWSSPHVAQKRALFHPAGKQQSARVATVRLLNDVEITLTYPARILQAGIPRAGGRTLDLRRHPAVAGKERRAAAAAAERRRECDNRHRAHCDAKANRKKLRVLHRITPSASLFWSAGVCHACVTHRYFRAGNGL